MRFPAGRQPAAPVQPPPLFALQSFNALISVGSILALMLGTVRWTGWEWSAWQIGVVTTVANLCYGGLVFIGGRLADRWGRARSGILGASLGLVGSIPAMISTEQWTTVMAAMCGFAGAAMFFPGSAGLFSDAEGAAGGPPPLHRKVRRYNLGWAAGNLIAFLLFDWLSTMPSWLAYGVVTISFLIVGVSLWRWRNLQPGRPAPSGDRAPHAALPRLLIMYRLNLFLACILCMAMITQVAKGLDAQVGVKEATHLASGALSAFAACYMMMFIVLGSWGGWILRPWALWAAQCGFLLGTGGLLALALCGYFPMLLIIACGGLIGSGYGAAYVGSIYYSLRLPEGVGKAAGWHETFIGLGNTMGPLLAGLFMSFVCSGVTGLAIFLLVLALAMITWQVVMIPGARRLGAR